MTDEVGIAEFYIARRGRASNALARFGGRSQMGAVRERQLVPVITLDSLLKVSAPPAFIKIDVEGAESVIFDGAAHLLNEIHPMIYVEVGPENIAKVSGQLRGAGYELFDPSKPIEGQLPLDSCACNTLAICRGH